MTYEVRVHKSPPGIAFPEEVLQQYALHSGDLILLKIGVFQQKIKLLSVPVEKGIISLSEDIALAVNLPEFVQYEIVFNNNTLHIGPVVGILTQGEMDDLNEKKLNILLNHVAGYRKVKGLVLLFTEDGINNNTVNGYAYNPQDNTWQKGQYIFPSALFCKKALTGKMRRRLSENIGHNFFNSQVFNKWELWQWLSKDNILQGHMPETVLAQHKDEVKRLIDQYKRIYIKPVTGMQGTGIHLLEQKEPKFHIHSRFNQNNLTSVLSDWESAYGYICAQTKKRYLAQQAVSVIKSNNRVIDFRVIVQKDNNGFWKAQGVVTRYGGKGNIVSNICSGGSAEEGWAALLKIYPFSPPKAYKKFKEMESLALIVCKKLEEQSIHLGNIGLDICIDENEKLWIIEVNNKNPDATIALDVNDEQLYYRLRSTPLQYARWLAGFRGDEK